MIKNGFIKVTYNVRACCCAGILYRLAHNVSPIEKQKMKICTIAEQ
jgi:hypothetical protein